MKSLLRYLLAGSVALAMVTVALAADKGHVSGGSGTPHLGPVFKPNPIISGGITGTPIKQGTVGAVSPGISGPHTPGVSPMVSKSKFEYRDLHAKKCSFGYCYPGKNHSHWTSCCWSNVYGCKIFYDPCCCCEYYFCVPDCCYYPITYCPYGCYSWPTVDGVQ